MIRPVVKVIMAAFGLGLIVGCAGSPPSEQTSATSGLPSWVTMPKSLVAEGGIAATDCVPANGSMSIIKAKSIALARVGLAQQINTNVQAMEKLHADLVENGLEAGSGSSFSSASRQLTDVMLQGAIPERVDYISGPNETDLFCSMVVMGPEQNRKIFEQIINKSNRQLSPENEALLYQEFRGKRAAEELEEVFGE